MSRKKDPVRRVMDLYAELSPAQRAAIRDMIYGFDLGDMPDLHRHARNFRRKPAAQSAVSQPSNDTSMHPIK